jgi:hypothetical protein
MSLDHSAIRLQVYEGFKRKFGRTATLQEAQILHAVGLHESGCGFWWKGAGIGSFNMGAITAGKSWTGLTFEYKDSYPDASGLDHWYVTHFRRYANAIEGWMDLANIMYEDRPSVLMAATTGDVFGVSTALYETTYYTGRGKTAKERIAGHYAAMTKNLITICRALNEPMPAGGDVPQRSIRRGDTGEDVKIAQRWLSLVADGIFGPVMETAVKAFQTKTGVTPDGIVGELTWNALEAEFEPKEADAGSMLSELAGRALELQTRLGEFVSASKKVNTE